MKIKRYFAPDIRQAIRQVREELGADAVILSNRRSADGVEIVAAVDYDQAAVEQAAASGQPLPEAGISVPGSAVPPVTVVDPVRRSGAAPRPPDEGRRPAPSPVPRGEAPAGRRTLAEEPLMQEIGKDLRGLRGLLESQLSGLAWGELGRRHPHRAELLRRLAEFGIAPRLANEVANAVDENGDIEHNWHQALGILAANIPVVENDLLAEGGIIAILGPTGVGKSTTVAKLAVRYALQYGARHVGLINMDTYRIGGHEQMRSLGRILGVPVRIAGSAEELHAALDKFRGKKLVLIDTAGMSQRDLRMSEQFATIMGGSPMIRSYVVLSTTTHRAGLDEVVKAFNGVELDGCILSKLDETTSLGGALSTVIRHRLPVAWISDGQRVPEDLHPARAHNLISRAVATQQRCSEELDDETVALTYGRMVANGGL